MNASFLDRVLIAQKEWQAVPADGTAIQMTALQSINRCAEAVHIICENLRGLGYEWASNNKIPVGGIERNIQKIGEAIHSPVPQILEMFWKIVGGVSFVDLETYRHVEFWKELKLFSQKYYCDGLHVDNCSEEWSDFICSDFVDWLEFRETEGETDFLLALSPDGYHKDNISGGAPYGVFAGLNWKPIWENFEWSGVHFPITALSEPPDFLSYLRTTILECAGFPAFLGLPGFERIREQLLRKVPVF